MGRRESAMQRDGLDYPGRVPLTCALGPIYLCGDGNPTWMDKYCGGLLWLVMTCFWGYFIVVGAMHTNDPYCDVDNTGNGLGQWMLVQGCFSIFIHCGQSIVLPMHRPPNGSEAQRSALFLFGLPMLFLFCWWIYGLVLVFKEHPMEVDACSSAVMIPSAIYVLLVTAMLPASFCIVCGGAALSDTGCIYEYVPAAPAQLKTGDSEWKELENFD